MRRNVLGNMEDETPAVLLDTFGEYYGADNGGTCYQANYDLEMINVSTGTMASYAVIRTYFYAAQFATTSTGNNKDESYPVNDVIDFVEMSHIR